MENATTTVRDEELKLIVLNYGKWKDAKAMEEFLKAQDVAFLKVQKARQLSFGFIHFRTREDRDAALPRLQALEWNNEPMEIKDALPKKSLKPMRSRSDGRGKKRNYDATEGGEQDEGKDTALEPDADGKIQESGDARDVVTPWAHIPYEQQLQMKESEMKKVLVKIVRLTRKEYAKKEKRIAIDQRNIARKKKKQDVGQSASTLSESANTDALGNLVVATPLKNLEIPQWLSSHGSLYVVANDILYSRTHEANDQTGWTMEVPADNIVAIVSFGSELVAAKSDNQIYALKQSGAGKIWEKICDGPSDQISSLASLRGSLLCCTITGKIFKQEGSGRFASGQWKEIGEVQGALSIGIHNGYLYAYCPSPSEKNWRRAPLDAEALEVLSFETYDVNVNGVLGIASHNTQLILLTTDSLCFVGNDGKVKNTIPLEIQEKVTKLHGFASHKGLCCPMDSIHPSPVTEEYRNKCEFSIGFDVDDKPCIGFRLGLFRNGSVVVSKPDDCINVSKAMKEVCAIMQNLVETSGFPVYDVKTQTGVWRMLTVRESARTKDLMVMVQVNPEAIDAQEKEKIQQMIIAHLTSPSDSIKVTSIYLQEYAGVSAPSENDPVTNIYGRTTIEEHLLGMRFSVSPNAFFQVNTLGAETLYSLVKQHANADANTLLYDVCCGTGTIGICASEGVGKVVGIEICKAATDDAAVNAKLNGVENVTFINSKAEDVMKDLLKAKRNENEQHLNQVVAIVDPPRAGLHHQVLRSLRSCPPVQRIVYVSCNPTNSLIQDAMTLCGPNTKSITGDAFEPVHAIPVDMFPHTPHCEMIIVFERVKSKST